MRDLNQNSSLYVDTAKGKGRGLFAKKGIKASEEIEMSPAMFFDGEAAREIDKTCLYDYYFSLSHLTDEQALNLGLEPEQKWKS